MLNWIANIVSELAYCLQTFFCEIESFSSLLKKIFHFLFIWTFLTIKYFYKKLKIIKLK